MLNCLGYCSLPIKKEEEILLESYIDGEESVFPRALFGELEKSWVDFEGVRNKIGGKSLRSDLSSEEGVQDPLRLS